MQAFAASLQNELFKLRKRKKYLVLLIIASAICVVGGKAGLKMDGKCVIRNCTATGSAVSAIVASDSNINNGGVTFEGNTSESGNPNYTDLTGHTRVSGTPLV